MRLLIWTFLYISAIKEWHVHHERLWLQKLLPKNCFTGAQCCLWILSDWRQLKPSHHTESITTVVVLKLKIEKGKYTAVSTFSIKLWIYLFYVVVLQRYQNVRRTCFKSLSYKLEPNVQRCTRAALTGLITGENFPTLSLNRCLADCFASCENIVSRSQALLLPPPLPLTWTQ